MTGAVGIEPTSMVLETTVLPLNYAPICFLDFTKETDYSMEVFYKQALIYAFKTDLKMSP